MKIKSKLQHNTILYMGVGLFSVGLLLLNYTEDAVNLYSTDNFSLFTLQAIIVAPIIEEAIFRGSLLQKSRFFFLSLTATILYFLTALWNLDFWAAFLSASFAISMTIYRRTNSRKSTVLLMIINSICFGLLHFNSDYENVSILNLPYAQIGTGFILSWVMINYNLKLSIIGHSVYNSTLILLMFIALQFPKSEEIVVENQHYKLTIVQVPYFNNGNYTYTFDDGIHSYKNTSIKKLINFPPLRDDKFLTDFTSNDLFGRYDITISMSENNKLEAKDILNDLKELRLVDKVEH